MPGVRAQLCDSTQRFCVSTKGDVPISTYVTTPEHAANTQHLDPSKQTDVANITKATEDMST